MSTPIALGLPGQATDNTEYLLNRALIIVRAIYAPYLSQSHAGDDEVDSEVSCGGGKQDVCGVVFGNAFA